MENRRKSLRIPIATIAHITPHGMQSSTEAEILDLSTGGMSCHVDHLCQKGDIILTKVRLDLPGPDSGVIQSSLMGRVVWVKLLDEEEKKYAVGLEFNDMKNRNPRLHAYLKEMGKQAIPA